MLLWHNLGQAVACAALPCTYICALWGGGSLCATMAQSRLGSTVCDTAMYSTYVHCVVVVACVLLWHNLGQAVACAALPCTYVACVLVVA